MNHYVVLMGWEDGARAWFIKNSWGRNWGNGGFAWVGYDSNNLGAQAAWVEPVRVSPTRLALAAE